MFINLKIIKNFKRNSIGQNKLRDLALLCIEHKETAKMDIKDLINDFANVKARYRSHFNFDIFIVPTYNIFSVLVYIFYIHIWYYHFVNYIFV